MIPWEFLLENSPAIAVAIPLLGAFATPLIGRFSRRAMLIWVILSLILTELMAIIIVYMVNVYGIQVYVFGASSPDMAIPPDSGGIPVRIIFTVDGMSAFTAVVSATLGLVVGIYSTASEKYRSAQEKFFALLLLLVVGMMGMALTGDMFNFFVFLEINSLAAAALVSYHIHGGRAVEAAFKYAIISSIGALMILFAIGILYGEYDALNIAMIAERMRETGFSTMDMIAMTLILVTLAMKCGAVPMHYWVPDGYGEAPGGTSALLVVASQASLYGLFRMSFTVFGLAANMHTLGWFLIILGILSMFIGVTMAFLQHDIKRLMAYHAVSQTGYMLLGVGVGLATMGTAAFNQYGLYAMEGGIFHIINHALYKGLLFLTAGAVIYRVGTSDLNRMGGLAHSMKFTAVFFLIGAFSIAGIPPFNGFASKLMIYESVYQLNPILAVVAAVVSMLTLASFLKVFHAAFLGPRIHNVKEVPGAMLVPMAVLAFLIVLFGIFPNIAIQYLVSPAAHALANPVGYLSRVLGGGVP